MKKITLLFLLFVSSILYSQTNGITYQALLLDPAGEKVPGVNNANASLANKDICLRFTILDAAFKTEYQETITIKTDEFGMVNTVIGSGRQSAGYASSFSDIYWDVNNKSLKVAVDINGQCATFIEISEQPLTYVPFAFSAKNAENVTGVVSVENGGTNAITVLGAKINLGLENVDNTRDLDKPIGTATQLGLNLKENLLNKSIDVTIDGASETKYPTVKAVKTYVDASSSLGASALALEISRTIATENTIAGNLAAETKRAELAEGLNATAISAEKTRAETAEEILTNNFGAEAKARAVADEVLADALAIELARASKAEGTLTSDLRNETNRATKAEVVLATNLAAAIADRAAADLLKEDKSDKSFSISTDGGSDIKYPSVKSVKEYVDASATIGSESLNAEINRASTAEKSIAVDLATETKRAGLAEIANATAISEETKRAGLAETANATAISDETQRAENAENTLREDLASEKARAIAAEVTKENAVNKSTDVSLADETNTKFPTELAVKTYVDANAALGSRALTLEVARATDAERANATAISDETKRAGLAETANAAAILDETKRAEKVEDTLTDDLASERARAIAAEAIKENAVNKSTDVSLADETNTKFPTELAVKTYVDVNAALGSTALAIEIARATDAEKANAAAISDETKRAGLAETANAAAILDETKRAENVEDTLTDDLASERARAIAAEAIKENAVNKSTDVSLADETNTKFPTELAVKTYIDANAALGSTALAVEIARATDAEKANATAISDETKRAGLAETANATAISDETKRAGLAETANAAAILDETKRAENVEDTLTDDLASERARAIAAEAIKENAVNKSTDVSLADETNTKFPTELAVKTYVDANAALGSTVLAMEIARATDAEKANATAISDETKRAGLAETDNATAISDETKRAGLAETANATAISDESKRAGLAETANVTAISDEIKRARLAETANAKAIFNEATAARAAELLKEDTANKSIDRNLGDSDVLFPTQNAVKNYVDNKASSSNYVDLTTDQTIGGIKTFINGIKTIKIDASATLDQLNTNTNAGAGNTLQWQSFTANKTGMLSAVEWQMSNPTMSGNPASVTVKLYRGEGVSGVLLGTANALTPSSYQSSYVNFDLNSQNISIVSGFVYTMELTTPSVQIGWLSLNTSNSYSLGRANPDPNWDFNFKTYVKGSTEESYMTISDATTKTALKEDTANKSTDATLADATGVKFPTELAVKTYVDANAAAGSTALAVEVARATDAEKANATAISDETKRAGLAETANATAISDENKRAENAENTLMDDLASEKARAIVAEATKENAVNKSTDVRLADETNTKFPTELAVKTYVDANAALGSTALAVEVARATDAEKANAAAISDETERAGLAEIANATAISDETIRAELAETTNATAISDETKRAGLAETANATGISDETKRAINAENTLTDDLASEKARAIVAEATLTDKLALEEQTARDAESANKNLIAEETTRAKDADAILTDKLALEAQTARDAESANKNLIADETTRAKDAEATLIDQLALEAQTARDAESANKNLIAEETTRAEDAEAILTDQLALEAQTARDAESANKNLIAEETTRAKDADAILTDKLALEAQTARDAESANKNLIADETARAKDAEATLTEKLDLEAQTARDAESANKNLIADETTRAKDAEATLIDKLAIEVQRAKFAESANKNLIVDETTRAKDAEAILTNDLLSETATRANADTELTNALALKSNIASPTFTGVPEAPTPINTTNSTQIATTAFVQDLLLNSASTPSTQLKGAIWTNSTSGTLNGVPFVLTNIRAKNPTSWDLSAPDFMAAPLSETQMLVGYSVSDDWTLTFASPVSDLKLYCRYWRAADYVFDQPFSILSGSGLVANNNTLTVNGWGNGVLEFAGPITTLNVNSNQVIGQNDSSQIMTFGANTVSQPLSGLGEVVRSNSPTFTGTPLATTADSGTSTTQIATTEFVSDAIATLSVPYKGATGPVDLGDYDLKINGTSFGTNGQPGNIGIGINAGSIKQGQNTIAIGNETGINTQGSNAVAIGAYTAGVTQGSNAVAVGYSAAYNNQGSSAVAIGNETASTNQGDNAIAIGNSTGYNNQGTYALAVGASAGSADQGTYAVAMGTNSGNANQGTYAIAVGNETGYENQGSNAVAVGTMAGKTNQGKNAIAIGSNAGKTNQNSNSIILNATGNDLDTATSGFFVDPIRNVSSSTALFYDASTKEITYGSHPSVSLTSSATGILPLANGGTGSATPNFVDLTTDQTIEGYKTFSDNLTANGHLKVVGDIRTSNDLMVSGDIKAAKNVLVYGNIETSGAFIKVNGSGTQFLKADGSVDENTYLTTSASATALGDLTSLTTTAKSNLVVAINEIEAGKSNFVDLTTDQTIAGAKTFGSDLSINGITVGRGSGDIATNTTVGSGANGSNSTGTNNTAIGAGALGINSTGSNNTALGTNAGQKDRMGRYVSNLNTSVFIGAETKSFGHPDYENNQIVIGYRAEGKGSNTIQLGNDQITAVNTNGSINSSGTITSFNLNTKSANIGSSEAEPSAVLSLSSSSQGFLPPRMTETQRIAISNPALGLVVYQVNNKDGLYFYNGTTWVYIIKQNGSSSEYLMADGSVSSKFKPTAAIADLHGITADLSGTVIYIPSADFNVVIEPELPIGFNCVIINAMQSAYTISMSEHPMFYSTQFKGVNDFTIEAGGTVHINVITVDNQKRYYISGDISEDISSPSTDVADKFEAINGQTSFTLTQLPSVSSKVKMYINGIRISNTAYDFTTTPGSVSYDSINNGGYELLENDRIQFDYF